MKLLITPTIIIVSIILTSPVCGALVSNTVVGFDGKFATKNLGRVSIDMPSSAKSSNKSSSSEKRVAASTKAFFANPKVAKVLEEAQQQSDEYIKKTDAKGVKSTHDDMMSVKDKIKNSIQQNSASNKWTALVKGAHKITIKVSVKEHKSENVDFSMISGETKQAITEMQKTNKLNTSKLSREIPKGATNQEVITTQGGGKGVVYTTQKKEGANISEERNALITIGNKPKQIITIKIAGSKKAMLVNKELVGKIIHSIRLGY